MCIRDRVRGLTEHETSYDTFNLNGMTQRAIYGDSWVFDVFTTMWYRFFYEFIFLCGYNGISDFFWNFNAQRIVFKSMKEISMDDSLRAKCGERDNHIVVDNLDNLSNEYEIHQDLL